MQRKIVEYALVYDGIGVTLASEVQKCIKEGWQPFGNVVWTKNDRLAQVVVKYEEEEEKEGKQK